MFSITSTHVNGLSIAFLFLYVPGSVLAIWAYRQCSMRIVMLIGSVLNLGTWICLFVLISPSHGYAWLMIDQIFPAIAAPFFLNSAALFAVRWFAPRQRDLATSIGVMANTLGLAIGSLLPPLIVTDSTSSNQFLILLASEAALTTWITLIVFIAYRSSPPTPPLPSDEQQKLNDLKKDLLRLITNRHYLILLFSFSFSLALFNTITSVLYQLIEPSGYSSQDAGVFGAVIIVTGLINAIIVGVLMDRTHAYRIQLKILLLGACGARASISSSFFVQTNSIRWLARLVSWVSSCFLFYLWYSNVQSSALIRCVLSWRMDYSCVLVVCSALLLFWFSIA